MQCNYCGENLAPAADVCPICQGAAPSPLGSPSAPVYAQSAKKKESKDISQLTCLLIALPIFAVDWLRMNAAKPDDVPFTLGQVLGHALFASLVAWAISKFSKTRFRLTWIITLPIVVVITMAQSLGAESTEAVSTGPLALPKVTWPAGWTPSTPVQPAGVDGLIETAMLVANGRNTASLSIMLTRHPRLGALSDEAKGMIDGQSEAASKKGIPSSSSVPTERTWLGNPAQQYDVTMENQVRTRQRTIVTRGSPTISCSVSYAAIDTDFEKYLPEFEKMKGQFVCPDHT